VPEWGSTFSVFYNKFGRRLDAVGDVRELNVYEEARDMLDIAVAQHCLAAWS